MKRYLIVLFAIITSVVSAQNTPSGLSYRNQSKANIRQIELRDSTGENVITYAKLIENPAHIVVNPTGYTLKSIEIADTYTRVSMHVKFYPKRWIITAKSYLIDQDHNKYEMKRFESACGIQPMKMFWMPESGEIDYDIIYPPLKSYAKSVSLTFDGDSGSGFYDIQLYDLKLPDVDWTVAEQESSPRANPLNELPLPEYKFGMATLKGHIIDFRPGMMKEIEMSTFCRVFDNPLDVFKSDVDSVGNYTFTVPVARLTPASVGRNFPMQVFLAPGDTTEVWYSIRNGIPEFDARCYATGPLASLTMDIDSRAKGAVLRPLHMMMDNSDIKEYRTLQIRVKDICETLVRAKGKVTPAIMEELTDICSTDKVLLSSYLGQLLSLLKHYNLQVPGVMQNEQKMLWMLEQISKYEPLDSVQLQSMATIPASYQEYLNYHLDKLYKLKELLKTKYSAEIASLPQEIKPKDIVPYLLDKYRGKKVLVHCWIPTMKTCKEINEKVIIPLQKEWNEKRDSNEMVIVHIAYVKWPQSEWDAQCVDLKGVHYKIYDSDVYDELVKSIDHVHENTGIANALYDERGQCVWSKSNFPDIEDIRKKLGLRKNEKDFIYKNR